MTHTAEQELTKLAKIKPFKRGDRQAFLADLLKGLDKTLDNMKKSEADNAYEALTQEAKEWYQGCIDRQDANPEAELPEFEDRDDPDDDDHHARNGDGGDADDIPFDAGADDEDDEPAPKPVAKAKPPVKRKPITLSPPKPEKAKAEAPAQKPTSRGVTLRPTRKPFKPAPVAPVAAKKANGPVKGARGNGIINVIIATLWRHPKDTVQELRARLEKRNVQTSEVTIAQERRTFKRQVAFLVQEGVIDKNPFADKR